MTSVYRYPLKAFTDKTDYLQIGVVEYTPIGKEKNLVSEPGTRRNTRNIKELEEIILLPIPSNIQDNNSTNYGSSELNSIAGAAVGGIMRTMEAGRTAGDIKAKLDAIGSAALGAANNVSDAIGGIEGVKDFATRQLASSAVGILGVNITPNQILALSEGTILNPNMELLFNGPTLRSFRFSFKMTSRNRDESIQIRNIIRCFKKNMVPRVDTDKELFLSTPNVFELTYRQGSREHSFLHKFKQCFLEDISVNYTGEGSYSTYGD